MPPWRIMSGSARGIIDQVMFCSARCAATCRTVQPSHSDGRSHSWTGLAGSGRMALIDHRDAAEAGLRVLTDPALWGAHHDLTGPALMSWPEALELLSAELGEPVTFRVAAERQFLERLTGAGIPAGTAELLITREWAILAGENDYTTGTFQQITGHPPRPVAEFLHAYRPEFL
jgi:NAD(P)H dehydrogenase (quinone)